MRYMMLGLAALLVAGVASAQPAPPNGAPPPGMEGGPGEHGHGMGEGRGGHGEMMRHMMEGGKAAHFSFRRGDSRVDIKCAADEPMKACVDAAMTLADKLAPAGK